MDGQVDPQVQQFIAMESQKHKFRQMVSGLTDVCWDKCIDKPGSRMESKTEICIVNCVERFIDTSKCILTRLQQAQTSPTNMMQ